MKRFFIAAVAMLAMVACSKDDAGSVLDSSKKSVAITISNAISDSDTRALTNSAVGLQNLACTHADDLVFVFCTGAGTKVTAKTINDAYESNGVYTFHGLDQSVSLVYVIANGAGSNKITTSNAPATVDAARTLWQTQTPDVEWDEIIVFGYGAAKHVMANGEEVFCEVDGHKYPLFEASVEVKPAHSRVEVINIACNDLGTKYNKITLQNLVLAPGLNGGLVQPLGSGNGFQLDATANPAVKSLTPGTGKAWSWNVKEQVATDLVLNVIVNEGNGWNIPAGTEARTVTVVDYKAPANYATTSNINDKGNLKQFLNGEIYALDLTFSEDNIHTDSDMLCVNVDVKIANWVVVPVTPVFN